MPPMLDTHKLHSIGLVDVTLDSKSMGRRKTLRFTFVNKKKIQKTQLVGNESSSKQYKYHMDRFKLDGSIGSEGNIFVKHSKILRVYSPLTFHQRQKKWSEGCRVAHGSRTSSCEPLFLSLLFSTLANREEWSRSLIKRGIRST